MEKKSIDQNDDRLKARSERMSGNIQHRSSFWKIPFFISLASLAIVFIVFPDEARRLLGFATSSSEDIQQTSKVDNSGISTQIQRQPELDIATQLKKVEIIQPSLNQRSADLNAEAKARLEALEKALTKIANQPQAEGGPTADDIKKLLDQQAIALRAEAVSRERILQAKLDALQAQQELPLTPTAETLAEQERLRREAEERERLRQLLRERKAARDAELLQRVISDGNVYDQTEEGSSQSGTKEDETGVRELSQNDAFLQSSTTQGFDTVNATDINDISRTIVQGTLIAAVLETAINTELPGNIRAQVMNPVYSVDGETILMPAGTRLIGSYNSEISIAQKRVLIAWNRAITPEGKSVRLAATGVDRLGRGGQNGNVDTRFGERFGSALLITAISAIPSFLANDDATGNTTIGAATDVAQDASDDLKEATEDILEEYLQLPPIIQIPQGTQMNVLVNQDLVFS
jgi:type IV secretion system protein VirB10